MYFRKFSKQKQKINKTKAENRKQRNKSNILCKFFSYCDKYTDFKLGFSYHQ